MYGTRTTYLYRHCPFIGKIQNSLNNRLDRLIIGHHKNLRYDYEAELSGTGSKTELNFEFFESYHCIVQITIMGVEAVRFRP